MSTLSSSSSQFAKSSSSSYCDSNNYSFLHSIEPRNGNLYLGVVKFSSFSNKLPTHKLISTQKGRKVHNSNAVRMQDGAVASKVTPIEGESNVGKKSLKEGILSGISLSTKESNDLSGFDVKNDESTVTITVVGASGDLAKKKIFPALFALYYEGCLPKHFTVFGYARSKMTDEELRNMVSKTLTCRIDKRENCDEKMQQFLKRCFYHSGQYDSQENFVQLDKILKQHEAGRVANRLYYLSIPPNIFIDAVKCASLSSSSADGWTRVIVEKHKP